MQKVFLFRVWLLILNVSIKKAPDVGRSVYVHFFGAVFGLAISKALHLSGVKSIKQASVYHSDLFSLIGTIFLFAYYPSFNGILAHSKIEQDKAIVNTFAAISASCVVTFAISSLGSKGKFNVVSFFLNHHRMLLFVYFFGKVFFSLIA